MTPPHDHGTIPHVDRTVTHVDRTVLAAAPTAVHDRLVHLADLLADRSDLRIDAFPDDGLTSPGASFWAVHNRIPAGGHAVAYEVTDADADHPGRRLDLRASSDLYVAAHRVAVAATTDGMSEVAWSVTVQPGEATTHQMLQDASVLARAALEELEGTWPLVTSEAPSPAALADPGRRAPA